jgi:hypothetical protein
MMKLLKLIFAINGMVFLISCEELMDIKFKGDSNRKLVVEGAITTRTGHHRVLLSYTSDFFETNEKEMASGAMVNITDGIDTFYLSEIQTGEYVTDESVHGKVGRTYTLNISLPDGKQYTASDYLGACADFDSIKQSVNYNTYSGYGYDVLFYGREPEPTGNYYMYLLYINNELYSDTITEISFASDEFVNGNYVSNLPVYRIRESDLKANYNKVQLDMFSISREYYEFLSALMIETEWRGSPWDGPPANLPGNVSNGAQGFFRASDVKRKEKYFFPLPRVN